MTDLESVGLEPLGEFAVRFAIPAGIDTRSLLDGLRALAGVTDAIVTDTHACMVFEHQPPDPSDAIVAAQTQRVRREVCEHRIRVRYDGADLDEIAAITSLSRDKIIALHGAVVYTVSFVGFMPGFAYLDSLDERLRLPRRSPPRTRVPAGSVAIAGSRTGIYPFASPGGWHLVGTAVDFVAFDPDRGATLATGDRVRFEPAE